MMQDRKSEVIAPPVNKWGVLIATLLGSFTVILNNSLMNVALPEFMNVYRLSAVEAQWIITGFAMAMVITMPLTGYLGEKLGKKNLYLIGMIIFLIGSLIGTFSWNFLAMVAFRVLQGLGGGLVMPLAMVLIFQHFPKEERGLATGIWGIAAMVAPAIGPVIGGFILNFSSWQVLYASNVPTAGISILAALYFLRGREPREKAHFDLLGFIFIAVGIIALMLGVERVPQGFDVLTILMVTVGVLNLFLFMWQELRVEKPLLDLRVFQNGIFTSSMIIVSLSTMGMFAGMLLVPLLVQDVMGGSPMLTGIILGPPALVMGLAMTIGGRLLDRHGPGLVVPLGLMILSGMTMVLGLLSGRVSLWFLLVLLMIQSFGIGFVNTPATTAGLNALKETQIPRASSINTMLRQLMKVVAVVMLSLIYESRRAYYLLQMPPLEAGIIAVQQSFFLVGVLVLLALPFAFYMRGPGEKPKRRQGKKALVSENPAK